MLVFCFGIGGRRAGCGRFGRRVSSLCIFIIVILGLCWGICGFIPFFRVSCISSGRNRCFSAVLRGISCWCLELYYVRFIFLYQQDCLTSWWNLHIWLLTYLSPSLFLSPVFSQPSFSTLTDSSKSSDFNSKFLHHY